jgi:hypothetical protein
MRDRPLIYLGLAVFVAALLAPVWYNLATGKGTVKPEPKLPATEKQCVADAAAMKATHMEMIYQWRDQVVRQGRRTYTAPGGRTFDMSLSRTCLKCHNNKKEFCDACHDYVAVKPYCWDCHVDPSLTQRSQG